jgi:hypothetical protein
MKAAGDNKLGIEYMQRVKFNRPVEYLFALLSIVSIVGPIYVLIALETSQYFQNTAVLISAGIFAFLL